MFEKRNTKLPFVTTQKKKMQLNPIPHGTAQAQVGQVVLPLELLLRPWVTRPVVAAWWALAGKGGAWQPLLLLLSGSDTQPSWHSCEMLSFHPNRGLLRKTSLTLLFD